MRYTADGPLLVPGPVRIELPDGTFAESHRVMVALCLCRRSRIFPFCDTSHRKRRKQRRASALDSCAARGEDDGDGQVDR
ncbi:CDGSH iron-sulfur domain-containing protein [Hoyosella sp. G463]|uniref:CDGSH iron-sulfur domain-containing protein n=1 Tax=Lolliginicoccus lacisalsi TaxID=2742202 RepID=A0A927PM53_9ACTN|nr:CDGSH iron-sulfur domain-containing protein [Lolliginicoccus lacisalsi]MBD8506449.1 CDGSH iron-sulfur domain-containing protein [Lolliginicoccus lacisalsi]